MKKPNKKKPAKKMTLLELITQKVDVRKLLDSIYIDEDNLIDAALAQPDLTVLAGRFRVQRFHVRAKLQTKLELERSKAGLRFRRIRGADGRKEFTEGAVKERVELDPNVQRLRKKVDDALAFEEMAKNLTEVFRTRSDSLRIVVSAGKVSVHAKELELLRTNKKLGKAVQGIRENWRSRNNGYED